MLRDFKAAMELRAIGEEMRYLEKKKKELCAPLLSVAELQLALPKDALGRKVYLLVAMLLCQPGYFVGQRMRRGLRNALARKLNVQAQLISRNTRDAYTLYRIYKDFHEEVDNAYNNALKKLGESLHN